MGWSGIRKDTYYCLKREAHYFPLNRIDNVTQGQAVYKRNKEKTAGPLLRGNALDSHLLGRGEAEERPFLHFLFPVTKAIQLGNCEAC